MIYITDANGNPKKIQSAVVHVGGGTDISDATAQANNILAPYTAYISSGKVTGTIQTKASSDITVSGATVTIPSGFYSTQVQKSVSSGSVSVNTPTVNSSGLVTASVSFNSGYISTAPSNKTLQLTTQAAKTITPSESVQTAVSSNKYTTGDITVSAIPSNYVGSGIAQRTSSNLTVSGATITAPAGYYASAASKSVATGSAATPSTTKAQSTPTITVGSDGKISANVAATYVDVTPTVSAGYVSSGTSGRITMSASSSSLQMSTQGTKNVVPTTVVQTAVASGVYTTGAITVAGDTNLVSANIAKGISIFGVTGTHEGGGGTASIEPKTETWQHNTWVTLSVDIDEEGNLSIRQSAGSGSTSGLKICYPQGSSTAITKIPDIPTVPGDYELPITASWSGDSNNHTLTYTVVGGGGSITVEPITFTSNGTYTAPSGKAYSPVTVNVSGGGGGEYTIYSGTEAPSGAQEGDIWIDTSGDTPVAGSTIYINANMKSVRTTSLSATGLSVTVEKAGKYTVSWMGARNNSSSTFGSRMYVNGSTVSGYNETTTFTNTYAQQITHTNVSLNAGDTVEIWARSRSTSYYMMVGNLIVERTGD